MKIKGIIYILLCSTLALAGSCTKKKSTKPTAQVKTENTTSSNDSIVVLDDRDFFSKKEEMTLDSFVIDEEDTLYFTLIATVDPRDTLTLSQRYTSSTGKNVLEIVHTVNYNWQLKVDKRREQIINTSFSKNDFIDTSDYSDLIYWFSNLNFRGYSSLHHLFLFDYWFAPDGSDFGVMKTFMINLKGEIAFIEFSGVRASCSCDVPASFSSDGKYVLMCRQLVDPANKFEGKRFPEQVAEIADMGWINNQLFWVLFDTDVIETEVNNLRIYDLKPRGYDMCSFNGFYCELGYSANFHNDLHLPFVHFYDHTSNKVILLHREKKPVIEKIDLAEFIMDDRLHRDSEDAWLYYFENTCMIWFFNRENARLEYNEIPINQ